MLQLHTLPDTWIRWYDGSVSAEVKAWDGEMIRVTDQPPRGWELVTRDLFQDYGPVTINGIGLSPLEGEGKAFFDHIYLGRTIADLDRITEKVRKVNDYRRVDPPPPAEKHTAFRHWRLWLASLIGAGLFFAVLIVFFWRVQRRAKEKPADPEAAVPLIAFPCPGCGKNLRARAALAGKSLKCPACGQGVLIPETNAGSLAPRASTGRFSILRNRGVVASVLVLAVVAGVCSWRFWPWRDKYSFLNAPLGNEFVPEVQESGFYDQEYDQGGRPFRWTNGKGRLVIPIDRRKPPTGLVMKLDIFRPAQVKTVWVQIVANNRELTKQQVPLGKWEGSSAGRFPVRPLDLTGVDLGDELVLDIISDTFISKTDGRTLGVLVRGVELFHEAPAPQ